jgi:hypothetical protein
MYAQLVPCGTNPEKRREMERLVAERLIPALTAEPGFAGVWNLVDGATGVAMMIVLWEAAEQAQRALDECGEAYREALASLAAITECGSQVSSVWEVGARI